MGLPYSFIFFAQCHLIRHTCTPSLDSVHYKSLLHRLKWWVPMTGHSLTSHPSREPPPVGKDEEREVLSVHVLDGLGCLEGGVRVPHLSCLADHLGGEGLSQVNPLCTTRHFCHFQGWFSYWRRQKLGKGL